MDFLKLKIFFHINEPPSSQIGNGYDPAKVVDEHQLGNLEARHAGNTKSSVSRKQGGIVPIQLQLLMMNNVHWNLK